MTAAERPAQARRVALVTSWVAYATYYLGRKNWSAIKKPLERELGLTSAALGAIDTAFLSAYALGQFASGVLGDRAGARRLVGFGMLVSALASAGFGLSTGAFAFGAWFVLNGLAQSTGWPGATRVVAEWTTPENRGTVMGLWSTCYQVGGLVATPLAGMLAVHFGWRAALFGPALALAAVGGVVLGTLPAPPEARASATAPSVAAAQRSVLSSRSLWLFGTSYFFIKLVRYALMFWLPYYLATIEGYSTGEAANVSIGFDAGGVIGVIVMGRLADRSNRFSHPALCVLWVTALVPVLWAYSRLGGGSALVDVLTLGLSGALLFGPDSLLAGAAAQNAGGAGAASAATGFVNGLGSFGAVLQGLVVPAIQRTFGWRALFPALAVFALGAVAALVPTLGSARPTRRT